MKYLGGARLAPYAPLTGRTSVQPLKWYLWNARLSSSLYFHIHAFEVCLRNAVDEAYSIALGPDWLRRLALAEPHDRPPDFRPVRRLGDAEADNKEVLSARRALADARRVVRERSWSPTLTHNDIVASTSLGLWVGLLGSRYELTFWKPHLAKIFNSAHRKLIEAEAKILLTLRNRIAHHDQIILRKDNRGRTIAPLRYIELMQNKLTAVQFVARLDPELAEALSDQCEYQLVLDEYYTLMGIAHSQIITAQVKDFRHNRSTARLRLADNTTVTAERATVGEYTWGKLSKSTAVLCSIRNHTVEEIFDVSGGTRT